MNKMLINYLEQMCTGDLEWLALAFGCYEADEETRIAKIAEHMLQDTDLEPFFTNDCGQDLAGLNPGCEDMSILCESDDVEWLVLVPVFVMWLLHRELTAEEDKKIQTVLEAYLEDDYTELYWDFQDFKSELNADCTEDCEMLSMVRVMIKLICEPEYFMTYYKGKLEEETEPEGQKRYRKIIRFLKDGKKDMNSLS